MGRKKAPKPPKAPTYKTAEIRYGNKVIGKTYVDSKTGKIVNQYIPDKAEEERKALAQQKINDITSTLGKTAPELAAQYDQTEQSFVNDATNKFLSQYDPALRDLRENTAARFGSLNNSEFFNNLNNLESNKVSALVDIINRGKSLKYDLVGQEEARKLAQLQAVGGVLNSDQSNLLNTLKAPVSASNSLNDFLNSQWVTQLQDYRNQQANKKSALANYLNMVVPTMQSYMNKSSGSPSMSTLMSLL